MKKERFNCNLQAVLIALSIAFIGILSNAQIVYADAYNDYWNDADDDYYEYWDDVDWEDDYDDGYRQESKSSDYLKLRKSSKATYFADTKNTEYGKYVDWCGRHGLLKGIAKKGSKVYPNSKIQKRQLRLMLKNGYRGDINLKVGSSKSKVTQRYFCDTTKSVAKQMNYTLRWSDVTGDAKMSMGETCYCLYLMIKGSKGTLYTYS